jgi:hypothetical protein
MAQGMRTEEAPWRWRDFTLVVSLAFETNMATGNCSLVLDLAEGATPGSQAVSIQFDTVAGLTLSEFGGGITQILSLDVRDISRHQWDRQTYQVVDLERNAISFRCQSYDVLRQYTI